MILPNYKDGSLINLVSSINGAFGAKSKHGQLKLLKSDELKDSKNIVLLIIDGLGYEYLMKNGNGTIFNENLKGKMTSVWPSSTTNAIPSLMTGTIPIEHEMGGWNLFLSEFGETILPLPYVVKTNKSDFSEVENIGKVFNIKSFSDKLEAKSYIVMPEEIVDSEFTSLAGGRSKRHGCKNMNDFFKKLEKVVKLKGRKYVHAYWPDHDSLGHKFGSESTKVKNHFRRLEKELRKFVKRIKDTETTLIITADHGMIDSTKSKVVDLEDHSKLKETLNLPLCGEHRYAYAYVKPDRKKDFEKYIKNKLGKKCTISKGKDLVKKGYFGPAKPSDRFLDRLGNYVIIMKDNYIIYDRLPDKRKRAYHVGDHGGFSKEEMFVPLIVIKS